MIEPLDAESRVTADDHFTIRLWLRWLTCTKLIEGRISANLRESFGISLARFDFLAQLERCPTGLRMTQLSRRMMVTAGNITRLADQLAAEGLITRSTARDDRRASIVRLTASGRRAFAEMARRHEEWLLELFAGLSASDRRALYANLATLKAHLVADENGSAR
jgi:DNA-binding MarR family transcriptional regulator